MEEMFFVEVDVFLSSDVMLCTHCSGQKGRGIVLLTS